MCDTVADSGISPNGLSEDVREGFFGVDLVDAAGFLGEVVADFGLAPPEAELGVIPLSLAFANKSLIPLRSLYSHKTIERSIQIKINIFERSKSYQIIVVLKLSFLFSIESDILNTQSKSKEKKGSFEKPFKILLLHSKQSKEWRED